MLSSTRAMKPKLSINIAPIAPLSISTSSCPSPASKRPSLSLKAPMTSLAPLRSPLSPLAMSMPSPLPLSPTSRNTKLNQRGFATMTHVQQPTYAYTNTSASRSILKKASAVTVGGASRTRQLQFEERPVVYSISPIEEDGYYGGYKKMTRDERRWGKK